MELHRFFRYAIEKMCKEKKSLNHFSKKKMNSAINYSIITKMVTAVLKRNEKKIPIGRKRLMAGWNENFMEKLILETINFLNIGD